MSDVLLAANKVTKVFGGLTAVREVDLSILPGEIRGLIGPNGAGKTTFFNCITGVYRPDGGEVLMLDSKINGLAPHRITKSGIARTFQQIRLFGEMTALENVEVGLDARHKAGALSAIFKLPVHRRENEQSSTQGMELLRFVGIANYANEHSRNLSYGDQRRLEIARALGTQPKLLLLDEPAAGMNPKEKEGLMEPHPQDPGLRGDHPAHRARHEGGHGRLRAGCGAGPRREDRRGPAGAAAEGPPRHRGLSGKGGRRRCCWSLRR